MFFYTWHKCPIRYIERGCFDIFFEIVERKRMKGYLIDKGVIHEVRSSNAQVQHVDLLQNSIVERVQEPGRVGHLQVSTTSATTCLGPLLPVYSSSTACLGPLLPVYSSSTTCLGPLLPVYSSSTTCLGPLLPVYSSSTACLGPLLPVYSSSTACLGPLLPV